jgi:HK97 family phage prohead protease
MTQQPILTRLGLTELDRPDRHTLTGRAVPYDQATDVTDLLPSGEYDRYREGFRAGAFDHQFNMPQRVRLKDGHTPDGNTGEDLAIATAMRNEDGGLMVDFRVFDAKASMLDNLLEEGVRELSVGFSPARMGTEIDNDGTRWRTKALLRHVALELAGAYDGAQVLAFRGDPDGMLEEADAEYERKVAELDEWLALEHAKQAELVAMYAARGLIDAPPAG